MNIEGTMTNRAPVEGVRDRICWDEDAPRWFPEIITVYRPKLANDEAERHCKTAVVAELSERILQLDPGGTLFQYGIYERPISDGDVATTYLAQRGAEHVAAAAHAATINETRTCLNDPGSAASSPPISNPFEETTPCS